MKIFILLTILLFAVQLDAAEIRIATAHTFIKKVFDPIRVDFKKKTGIDITILFNSPFPALAELEKESVDIAGASLKKDVWLEDAQNAGVSVKDSSIFSSYVPTVEKSMIAVNAENKVKKLSKGQLKAIFTGKIVNWKEVGGDDAPIIVIWPMAQSGAIVIFQNQIMDNEPLTKTVMEVESMAETSDAILATPEAIGIVGGILLENGLKEVAPPIERPLTLLWKGEGSPNVKKLINYIKGEGKLLFK